MGALKSLEDCIPEAIQNRGVEAMTGRKYSDQSAVRNSPRSRQLTLKCSAAVVRLRRSLNLLGYSP